MLFNDSLSNNDDGRVEILSNVGRYLVVCPTQNETQSTKFIKRIFQEMRSILRNERNSTVAQLRHNSSNLRQIMITSHKLIRSADHLCTEVSGVNRFDV